MDTPAVGTFGVGLHWGATDTSAPILDLALLADELGFHSLVLPDHTHIPSERVTPYIGGGPMPDRYRRLWDPYVAGAFVAAQTRLLVGTCVSLVGERDPIVLAKQIATVDRLSGGRFLLGIGFGWNAEEFEDHGHAFVDRYSVVAETVAVLKELWTKEEASFAGKHFTLPPTWSWPKPLQVPHPPVLIGGMPTERTFRRVAEWADGWIPMSAGALPTLESDLAALQEAWADAGRGPEGPRVMCMQRIEPIAELAATVAELRRLGVEHVFIDIPTEPADVLHPMVREVAAHLDLAR